MSAFQYSVVRFVPSPTRGEFVNLGIIAGNDKLADWSMQLIENQSRAKKLDDSQVLPSAIRELKRLSLRLRMPHDLADSKNDQFSIERLLQLAEQSQGVIQYSFPKKVIAESAQDAVNLLWNHLVVDRKVPRKQHVHKSTVIKCFIDELRKSKLGDEHFKRHWHLETSGDKTPIDVAVHKGEVKELTQCWSFQVADLTGIISDVKSWAWTMRTLRDRGGMLGHSQASPITVPKNVKIGVVYVPGKNEGAEITEQALEVFKHEDVLAECVTFDKVGEHAHASAKLVGV